MPSARLSEGEVIDQLRFAFANPAAIADNAIVAAPGAGYKIVVYGYQIDATGGANTVIFKSAANAKTATKGFVASGGMAIPPGVAPLFECNENEALNAALTAATAVGIDVQYCIARV